MASVFSLLLTLLAIVAVVNSEVVFFQNCPDSVNDCTVNEVRVDPCPQAATRAPCNIRRRRESTMSFDFTPNFDADQLDATLGWAKSDTEELPLVTLEKNACKATTCPVKSGEKHTYDLIVPIEKKFPISPYTIRWALKDPVTQKRCCFTIDIKVVR